MSSEPYILQQQQWIERPVDEVFAFFADARNLEQITPPWLAFKILSMSTATVSQGTVIRYRLRLHGIPMYWQTDICEWNPPHGFVDEQRTGPYKQWIHTHRFESHEGRTKMIDVVKYSLPFGILGHIVHRLKVREDVRRIFDYRRQQIDRLFSEQRRSAK